MTYQTYRLIPVVFVAGLLNACESDYKSGKAGSPGERQARSAEVTATIARFKEQDPSMQKFFDNSAGYAVFPNVGKGGIGIGGAFGRGELFEHGKLVGYTTLKQGTVGFQLGGQTYSEIIFFQNQAKVDDFKGGHAELSAQASAVAATKGASANADYKEGVAVFTMAKGGLMFEASVGGQGFDFEPLPK